MEQQVQVAAVTLDTECHVHLLQHGMAWQLMLNALTENGA